MEDKQTEYLQLETEILKKLKTIYDPEIPVNIYDLGLIYEINVDDYDNVEIIMTLTAPNCPVADSLPIEIRDTIKAIQGVKEVTIELVFEPEWSPALMSEEAKLELGYL